MGHILAKMELNLKDVKGFILSPGNIFWKQKSGNLILLCAKSDFLNLELIEKLFKAQSELLIENQIDFQIQDDFREYFTNHQNALLVKEKNQWRNKLLGLFAERMSSAEVTQFELNQLAWKTFSKVEAKEAQRILEEDLELFRRGASIATSYTLIAFILGYYSDDFLSKLFTETFLSLMTIEKVAPLPSLKAQLEKIRTEDSWSKDEKVMLENVYHLGQKKNLLIGERFDGSGINSINKREMTDLEIVQVALNQHYSYLGIKDHTIFFDLKNASFSCDQKIVSVLQKSLNFNAEAPIQKRGELA